MLTMFQEFLKKKKDRHSVCGRKSFPLTEASVGGAAGKGTVPVWKAQATACRAGTGADRRG